MENPGNTKAKTNRWDSTNIKSFLLANEAIDRSQMTSDRIQAASRPHVTANGIRRSDKRLISRVHKNLKQCNTETQARGLKNWLRPTPLVFTQLRPPLWCHQPFSSLFCSRCHIPTFNPRLRHHHAGLCALSLWPLMSKAWSWRVWPDPRALSCELSPQMNLKVKTGFACLRQTQPTQYPNLMTLRAAFYSSLAPQSTLLKLRYDSYLGDVERVRER